MKTSAVLLVLALAACSKGSQQAKPTPAPAPSVLVVPTPPPPVLVPPRPAASVPSSVPSPQPSVELGSTLGHVALAQIFDFSMTDAQAKDAARTTEFVWGAGTGNKGSTALSWRKGNATAQVGTYTYQPADVQMLTGHHVDWFVKNHPDWVVYLCDANNQPTHQFSSQPGLGTAVALDISNPAVARYQVDTMASYLKAHGSTVIDWDQTLFFDFDGGTPKGYFGCGVYRGGHFVRLWGAKKGGFPNFDPQWNHDVAQWAQTAHDYLRSRYPGLKMAVNHPAGNISNPDEQKLLANVDYEVDENGFINYGHYKGNLGLFKTTMAYLHYTQSHGIPTVLIDKFSGSVVGGGSGDLLSPEQITYVVATYLLANDGKLYLFTTAGGGYGKHEDYPLYAQAGKLGKPTGAVSNSGTIYSRSFEHGTVTADPSTGIGTVNVH